MSDLGIVLKMNLESSIRILPLLASIWSFIEHSGYRKKANRVLFR